MKLLIGGKSRNIYMRKDGSAYYKSGGEKVDASYMFKKNGDLKKQYSENVKETHRIKKNKKFYGGNPINITFQPINFDSDIEGNKFEELLKLVQIAYNVVLERSIHKNGEYNVVDGEANRKFLIGVLFALQDDLLTSFDTNIVNKYDLRKNNSRGKKYYSEIEKIFRVEDFDYVMIIEKLNNLIKKLWSLKKNYSSNNNSTIDAMFENIKSIIGEVSVKTSVNINATVGFAALNDDPSSETDNVDQFKSEYDAEIESNEQSTRQSRQSRQKLSQQAPSLEQQQQQLEQKQLEQQQLEQQQLEQQQLEQKQQLKQQQQQLEQKQKQQLKQQQQQLEQKQKQLEQLKIIQRSALALTREFLQQYDLDPKDYFNSLDYIIKRKIELMKFIEQEINSIQSIFITNQSKHLGNERQIMQVVLIAEQIVVRIEKNVKEGLYTKIQELKDAKQISIPQYNQNMESTKQLLEIIKNTFKKIERVSKSN